MNKQELKQIEAIILDWIKSDNENVTYPAELIMQAIQTWNTRPTVTEDELFVEKIIETTETLLQLDVLMKTIK